MTDSIPFLSVMSLQVLGQVGMLTMEVLPVLIFPQRYRIFFLVALWVSL